MLTLAIETATAACSVALIEDGRVVANLHAVVGRGHAERLVPMVAALIAGRDPPGAVLVDCGPGSFTGVRVGLAAARAFGFAWGAEVGGLSSLGLIAAMARRAGPLAVAIPGGHGELFVQRFDGADAVAPAASLPPEAAAAAVPETHVYGEGAAALVAARGGAGIAQALLPDAAFAPLLPPAARALPPAPVYGRPPDAQLPTARPPVARTAA